MDRDVETSTDVEALRAEVMRLRTAIRQHKGGRGHERCKLDDHVLYSVLPDGDQGWEPQLPPLCEWMAECKRYWHARQEEHQPDPEYGGVVVTGTPGGDGECWHFVVTADEYRRVMGEEDYQLEMKFRQEAEEEFSHIRYQPVFTLAPSDLLRAAGLERDEPVTLWLQLRKPDAPKVSLETSAE